MVRTRDDLRWLLFEEWCTEMGPDSAILKLIILRKVLTIIQSIRLALYQRILEN